MRAGMSANDARLAALRLIGPIALHQEECRDAHGTRLIETSARDLQYAVRMLRRSPLFTGVATVTLALGIGANTTVFTFVENILMRSLPVRNPQELVSLNWGNEANMSYPNYADFLDRNRVFSGLIACDLNVVSMSIQARDNFRVSGYEVSGNYFETLGISPQLGRFFTPAEDATPGANPVVVVSDRYWRSRFAADPRVIGRVVKINGYPFTIIGVAPPSFLGTEMILAGDYWAPMSMELQIAPRHDWLRDRGSQTVWTLGRLKPGVSRKQAEADLNRIARQLARTYPNEVNPNANFVLSRPGLVGKTLREPITGFGIAFMTISGMALLLACVNLAGMLLARSSDRHREIGIRLAIGASRFQLLRQLMTESLLLALIGGSLGLAVAYGGCQLISSWHPAFDFPIRTTLQPDGAVLAFTLASSILTIVLFGLAPALQAVRIDLIPSLKDAPISVRFRRLSVRDLLVAGQIALSVILLISSVLVVRSLQHALTLNLGFNPTNAVSVSFDLRLQGYDEAHSRRFIADLLQNASTLPGLKSAAIINNLPLRANESNGIISRADRPMPPRSEWRSATIYNISPGYLVTAGTRLLLGRDVNDHDHEGTPSVAIVNEALVRLLFGNENTLGKRLRLGNQAVEIIGVVETGKYEYLSEDPHPAVFLPIAQTGLGPKLATLVARTPLPAQQATDLLRKAVLDLDPELTLFDKGSLKDQLSLPLFPARAAATVLSVFGVLAMVLAGTGLFALMAYSVARRTREIGIRMALGARPGQVLSSVLRRTLILSGIGVSIGALVTVATGRLLSAILYGISPHDPMTYATAILLMAVVALLACWSPAARAIRIDPARALRDS
jgi:predicted permease